MKYLILSHCNFSHVERWIEHQRNNLLSSAAKFTSTEIKTRTTPFSKSCSSSPESQFPPSSFSNLNHLSSNRIPSPLFPSSSLFQCPNHSPHPHCYSTPPSSTCCPCLCCCCCHKSHHVSSHCLSPHCTNSTHNPHHPGTPQPSHFHCCCAQQFSSTHRPSSLCRSTCHSTSLKCRTPPPLTLGTGKLYLRSSRSLGREQVHSMGGDSQIEELTYEVNSRKAHWYLVSRLKERFLSC